MSEQRFTFSDTRLGRVYTAERGEGGVALLLHGISSSADVFAGQMSGLWTHRRLIAWDAPGYGRSADPASPPSLDDYADAAMDVCDARGLHGTHIVGSSWGGVVAARIALRHPERVATLALIGSTPGRRTGPEARENLRRRCAVLSAGGVADYARDRAHALISPVSARRGWTGVVEYVVRASVRMPGYEHAALSLLATDHTHRLADVRVPTSVIVGADDCITGPGESQVLADGIPGAVYEVIDDAGHLVHLERPDPVNEALLRLWSRPR